MASHPATAASYRREIGGGLIQRWSTPEDIENIAQLCGFVFRENEKEGNPLVACTCLNQKSLHRSHIRSGLQRQKIFLCS